MFRPFHAVFAATALLFSIQLLAQTHYPITVYDGAGNEITLTKAPEKVSSKTLFTDEVLLSILSEERLSSLTNLASDPSYSNVAHQLPVSVPLLDLNVESILSNFPDLVFAADWSDSGKIEQLKRTGITVYLINTPTRWEDIQAEIRKIGRMLNAESEVEQLLATRNQQLKSLSSTVNRIRKKQLTALDYNTWGTASGVNTTWNTVLENAGITNGSAPFEQGAFGQVEMSKELIITVNPDILFLPGWLSDDNTAKILYEQIINDPALSKVKAIQTGHVYPVPEHLRGTYSQYIIDTISFVINTVVTDF